jgi:hypothetical protein
MSARAGQHDPFLQRATAEMVQDHWQKVLLPGFLARSQDFKQHRVIEAQCLSLPSGELGLIVLLGEPSSRSSTGWLNLQALQLVGPSGTGFLPSPDQNHPVQSRQITFALDFTQYPPQIQIPITNGNEAGALTLSLYPPNFDECTFASAPTASRKLPEV